MATKGGVARRCWRPRVERSLVSCGVRAGIVVVASGTVSAARGRYIQIQLFEDLYLNNLIPVRASRSLPTEIGIAAQGLQQEHDIAGDGSRKD